MTIGNRNIRSVAVVAGSVVLFGLLAASSPGCASDMRVGVDDKDASGTPPPPFDPVDAGGDVSRDPPLCATSECTLGTTTCSTSLERCDIDLTRDRNNCGACGNACPPDQHRGPWDPGPTLEVSYACEDSRCVMHCQGGFGNCDGIPDNGCETELLFPDNCGACGNACAEGVLCFKGHCGCVAPKVQCGEWCADLKTDVSNCGACGHPCLDDPPSPWEHNLQVACVNAECKRICRPPYADCNGDSSDGCETDLSEPNEEHCGECGHTCTGDDKCNVFDLNTGKMACNCPTGLQRCETIPGRFTCFDVMTDPTNCGGCGIVCTYDESHASRPVCRAGVCGLVCKEGFGDCNGFAGDGCEINLDSDPRNCGACGNECNAELGQPCVKGKCAEAECGGGSR